MKASSSELSTLKYCFTSATLSIYLLLSGLCCLRCTDLQDLHSLRKDELTVYTLLRNITDHAISSKELIELYGSAASDCARICLLKRHRRELLDDIHSGQQKLERLDYLIYRLRNASTECRTNRTASRSRESAKCTSA